MKQDKRVQELEETVEDYKTVNKELHLRGRKVRKQNKHYREAFKQIKLQILSDGVIEDHRKNIIEIIDKALESENK